MKQTYTVTGMTCGSCVASVQNYLSSLPEVQKAEVDLAGQSATLTLARSLDIKTLSAVLPEKYQISVAAHGPNIVPAPADESESKWRQLKPLFLIFLYLFGTVFFLYFKDWDTQAAMLDFMGLFYIVFSFFKFLDLKAFPNPLRCTTPWPSAQRFMPRSILFWNWAWACCFCFAWRYLLRW